MVAMQVLVKSTQRSYSDPTAGHMGEKRESLNASCMWSGIVRDVKEMVCIDLSFHQMDVYILIYHNQM